MSKKLVIDRSDEINYKRLKNLFFNLYELTLEREMFKSDQIDIDTKEYLDTLDIRIEECEKNIKTLLQE